MWSRLSPARSWMHSNFGPLLGEVAPLRDVDAMPLLLRVAVRASLSGMVAAVVLLGHMPSTQPAFNVVLSACLVVYLLARGEELVAALLDYLTSRTILWRWAFVAMVGRWACDPVADVRFDGQCLAITL